jgi:hypothetical protein
MDSHILERITSEKTVDVMRSIEFFIALAAMICTLGLVFIAVA